MKYFQSVSTCSPLCRLLSSAPDRSMMCVGSCRDVSPNDQPHLAFMAFQEDRGVGTIPSAHAFGVNDEGEIVSRR